MNIDSITEMPDDVGIRYFQHLSRRASVLYSINHGLNKHRAISNLTLNIFQDLRLSFISSSFKATVSFWNRLRGN